MNSIVIINGIKRIVRRHISVLLIFVLSTYESYAFSLYNLSFAFPNIAIEQYRTGRSVSATFSPGVYCIETKNCQKSKDDVFRLLFLAEESVDVLRKDSSGVNRIIDLSFNSDTLLYIVITRWQSNLISNIRVLTKSKNALSGNIIVRSAESDIEQLKKHKRKSLVGAIFFDGWSYKSYQGNESVSNQIFHQSELYETSGTYNTINVRSKFENVCPREKNPFTGNGKKIIDWRDFVFAKTGSYPPLGVSFCNFFSEEAASLHGIKYIDKNGIERNLMSKSIPSVEPIREYNGVSLGWRNTDSVEQMEAQIEMAAKYGIDYFVFNVKVTSEMIVGGKIDPNLFSGGKYSKVGNHALMNFLKCKNRNKLKFCLMLNVSPGPTKDYYVMSSFFREFFFSQPNYLKKGEKPLFLHFHECNKSHKSIIGEDVCQLGNGVINLMDGYFKYNGTLLTPSYSSSLAHSNSYLPSSDLIEGSLSLGRQYRDNENIMIPLNIGFDCSARSNFEDDGLGEYEPLSKEELQDCFLAQMLNYSGYIHDRYYLIYAWNEFCEGGWLMPTQQEYENGLGFEKLEVIKSMKEKFLDR